MGKIRFDTSGVEGDIQKVDALFQGVQESLGAMVEKLEEIVALMEPQGENLVEGWFDQADGKSKYDNLFGAINSGMASKVLSSQIQRFREGGSGDAFCAAAVGLRDVPQIPHLARGAVLPANRPFLAVVGDQRHGTNVEAPLEVIQEAVALVMGNLEQSNLAGHEATVAVLRQILDAVQGIEIGDEVIGRAAGRYDAKMAAIRGGW